MKQTARRKDFLFSKDDTCLLSLRRLTGKKIVDITGHPCGPFGQRTPVFCVYQIVFEDGTTLCLQAERETVYISPDDTFKNMDAQTLEELRED